MIRSIALLVIFWQPVPVFSLSILSLPKDGEGQGGVAPLQLPGSRPGFDTLAHRGMLP